jgi:hypothetical protein
VGPLITVVVLLAGAVGGLVLRELDGLEADIGKLEADMGARFVKLEADMGARFVKLEADMGAGFDDVDARFVKLEADMGARFVKLEEDVDARFVKLEEDMDARFDRLEAGQQEIALTLAALVAYLRADEGVDAALAGRLPDPASDPVG